MSIIHTFDNESRAVISPSQMINPVEGIPEIIVICFSDKFTQLLLQSYETEIVTYLTAGMKLPIYKFSYKGKKIGFFQSLIGGAASGGLLEELLALGGKKILYFGSCGSLNQTITGGHLIVPTEAYRDEGFSYHYAPAGDYITIETAEEMAQVLDDLQVPYIKTKTWTTDAIYRETEKNVAMRKAGGCSVVEMECASIMSLAQFRKAKIYQFLYAADCLDGEEWNKRILGDMPQDMRERILQIAMEAAIRLI